MKHFLTLIVAIALFSVNAWAQCTPTIPSSSAPGLYPMDSLLPCIERTVQYDEVIEFKNFETVDGAALGFPGVTATVDSIRIDTITNIPAGISPMFNNADRIYAGGEIGCILLTGTTTAAAGSYTLGFEATVWPSVGGFAVGPFAVDSATLASVGLSYILEVIEPGTACRGVLPNTFTATVTGSREVCPGETTTLTVIFTNGVPPYDILWTGGSTTSSITVGAGTYDIVAVDSNTDTARTSVTVTELPLPTADFAANTTAGSGAVTVTDNSTNATTYTWYFSDLDTIVGASPSFTFTENGEYDITLITENTCGSDTTVETITISGIVGIKELGSTLSQIQVVPNPSNGNFSLNLVATENSPVTVKVFNLQGQQVYATTYNVAAGQASTQAIALGNAASGIYIIQVQANDALVTEKLMVK